MSSFPEALPHGSLEQIFENIFFVTGTVRPNYGEDTWQFSRNMIVLRQGTELILINTVRLDERGLEALDALGEVRHIFRLGNFHGIDDPFYLDRYTAIYWHMQGMPPHKVYPSKPLHPESVLPVEDATIFSYETSAQPEGILHINRQGGVLIACDSLQNWAVPDKYFDEASRAKMTAMGFIKKANIGPGWLQYSQPKPSDFQRLKELSFQHLLSGHGQPLLHTAHEDVAATIKSIFSI